MLKLAILICSIYKRENKLKELMKVLSTQSNEFVRILVETDNGEMSIGKKRNNLLELAKQNNAEYIVFVDDDDMLSDDYVIKILKALEQEPDCCGMEGIITFDGKNPKKFIHSIRYDKWCEKDGIYYRYPNHLNPVKIELALQVKFPEKDYGEDKSYSDLLFPLLKREVYIPGVIYHYKFSEKNSESNKKK